MEKLRWKDSISSQTSLPLALLELAPSPVAIASEERQIQSKGSHFVLSVEVYVSYLTLRTVMSATGRKVSLLIDAKY